MQKELGPSLMNEIIEAVSPKHQPSTLNEQQCLLHFETKNCLQNAQYEKEKLIKQLCQLDLMIGCLDCTFLMANEVRNGGVGLCAAVSHTVPTI